MQADPFLFVHNETLYLFYEEMLFEKGLGLIKMTCTKDLKTWSEPLQITHEPQTHFSYPFVFEYNDEVYMLPETGCDHNIRLYKAMDNSLSNFKYAKTLLERRYADEVETITFDYADSCILNYDDKFYLFTSIYQEGEYRLELYVSDNFDRGYQEHPKSPIDTGNRTARCGGSLICEDNKLYRPCQDCSSVYGGQLHIKEIIKLSPTEYEEIDFKQNVIPQHKLCFKEGGHHINKVQFKGQDVLAMDCRFTTSFLLERIRFKIVKFFKKIM